MFRVLLVCALAGLGGYRATNASSPLEGKIVGGEFADIIYHPHQLSLQFMYSHICGASLLTPTRVLTAAHCLFNHVRSPWALSVYGGQSSLKYPGQYSRIHLFYMHPKYNNPTLDYDVAVLILQRPFLLTPTVQPIALQPPGMEVATNTMCTVTGWGKTIYGYFKDILRVVNIPKYDDGMCARIFAGITSRKTCFGYSSGIADICTGDSGGAMVCNGYQVGIVSASADCLYPGYPSIYTKIANAEIYGFITEILNIPFVWNAYPGAQ